MVRTSNNLITARWPLSVTVSVSSSTELIAQKTKKILVTLITERDTPHLYSMAVFFCLLPPPVAVDHPAHCITSTQGRPRKENKGLIRE